MCSNSLSFNYDQMFDDESSNDFDLNFDNETPNYLNDMNFNIDYINDTSFPNSFNDPKKDLDIFCEGYLPLIEDILEKDFDDIPLKSQVKAEPYSNSITSGCVTDDSSHPSSTHSSPVSRKSKREYTNDNNNNISVSDDELIEIMPKSAKLMKHEQLSPQSIPVYKLMDVKPEPKSIYINSNGGQSNNIVTIRANNSNLTQNNGPNNQYVLKKLRSINLKTQKMNEIDVNTTSSISNNGHKYHHPTFLRTQSDAPNGLIKRTFTVNNDVNSLRDSISPDSDYERDNYKSYRSFSNSYYNQNGFSQYHQKSHSNSNSTIFQHPIPTSGELILTNEEKRTMLAEGFAIPTKLPLSKQEERNLKKVRRKIKNKISAQESRRKKKEYVDALEKKVDSNDKELMNAKKKAELLENDNRNLQNQLRQLKQQLLKASSNNNIIISNNSNNTSTKSTNTNLDIGQLLDRAIQSNQSASSTTDTQNNTSTTMMLFMLCFVLVVFGGQAQHSKSSMNLPSSRLIDSASNFYNMGYGGSSDNSRNLATQINNSAAIGKNNKNMASSSAIESIVKDKFAMVTVPYLKKSGSVESIKSEQSISKSHFMTRPAVLLGDESDECNFQDFIRTVTTETKRICDVVDEPDTAVITTFNPMLNKLVNSTEDNRLSNFIVEELDDYLPTIVHSIVQK